MAASSIALADSPSQSVFKPALLLMAGRMLAFAATFFIPVVLVRLLTQTEFGTYKQLFLIFSTGFLIGQIGMAQSLYYFIPLAPASAGKYAANSMLALGLSGSVACVIILFGSSRLAGWLSNPDLPRFLPWIGAYMVLMLLSTSLEIVMISRGSYLLASASYALSDLARAAAILVPALLVGGLDWLLRGAVFVAAIRLAMTVLHFRRIFGPAFRPDRVLLTRQAGYSFVFACAIVIEVLQGTLPQYAISYFYDPATLAIFAVGCLQIPLVEIASSPACDVMMVKMQESLASGRLDEAVEIWHDTTWKLAAILIPLTMLLWIAARDLFLLLFTERYLASVPIFMIWAAMIPLVALQVDGVLRVFAKTRLILLLNLLRLAVIGGLISWALSQFGLPGGAVVVVIGTLAFKAAALVSMRRLMGITFAGLLPWRRLAGLIGAAGAAALVTLALQSQLHLERFASLSMSATMLPAVYAVLVWQCKLLSEADRLALRSWWRRCAENVSQTMGVAKGLG